jgi:hypothetical protein
MKRHRRDELERALRRELEKAKPKQSFGPTERATWVVEQLENYVERWQAFCAIPSLPMPALLDDDLFVMIECGTQVLSDELEHSTLGPDLTAAWSEFRAALSTVCSSPDRTHAESVRSAFAAVRSRIPSASSGH